MRTFALVQETGGVRAAARRLSVSPSAVHRQLRELEDRVGVALTRREGRRIEFTAAGERLARQVANAVQVLEEAYETTRPDRRLSAVTIATAPSFAARWLLPLLPVLRDAFPNVDISIVVERQMSEIPREADLSIRMGAGPWPGAACAELMDEVLVPVASAGLAGSPGGIRDLLAMPRIHDRDAQAGWRRWGAAFGLTDDETRDGIRMTSSDLALDAAELGLGVAISRKRLAQPAIETGRLVAWDDFALPIGTGYWLIRPPQPRAIDERVAAWILAAGNAPAG